MKQLRNTEWRRGYPIKKNLALCAWGVLALAGFAGILARPENIPSLAACVLALAGAVLSLPHLLGYYRTTYQCLPALNRRLTKKGAGGAEVTFNIMNRDTTPVIFVYATGDTVKIDLGVQASVQKIRELNAYFRSRYHIFPGQADGKKTEELCSIFREIYTDYLKEKEPEKEDAVLAKLVKDAGELRQKCIEKMPPYLKRGD